MTARGIVIAVVAAGVIAGGIALVVAVNADVPDPEAKAHDKVDPPAAPPAKPAPPPRPTAVTPPDAGSDAPAAATSPQPPLVEAQQRLTQLEARTSDPNTLGELLGGPPTGFMLATIGTQAKVMRDAAAAAETAHREGKLSEADAIRVMRAAEDTYRATYRRVTGLSDAQLEQLLARP